MRSIDILASIACIKIAEHECDKYVMLLYIRQCNVSPEERALISAAITRFKDALQTPVGRLYIEYRTGA